ncbi:MAG: Asp/Glu racemase [Paracoccaceae bacterium]|nr:Asp/Glu racemase [Paracoccaceae bacterium]
MTSFAYEIGDVIGTRATLGLVALQTDETLEHDLSRLLPRDGVTLYTSRVPSGAEVTEETLGEMASHLTASAALFPPAAPLDVVGYGCTSGTSVIGAPSIHELIKSGCNARRVTEPVSALIAACKELGITKLGFLSPYIEDVSIHLRTTLEKSSIQSPVFGSFNEGEEAKVARIDTASIVNAGVALGQDPGCQALFLSCTNLRTLDAIPEIEKTINKPVLSSNLVLGWHIAKLAGLPESDSILSAK